MRNLLIFIRQYNAFFLFIIFELVSLLLLVNNNSFQKATYISSSNEITGSIYEKMSQFSGYLTLGKVNDSLAAENARLRGRLKSSFYVDTLAKHLVNDTVYKQQYSYIVAKVINNSTNRRNNYITINRGTKDGVTKDMGVICANGVVGTVVNTTDHLANVQSVLHKSALVSAMLTDTKSVCSFRWGDDMNIHQGILFDVTNNFKLRVGEDVVTSGYSSFFPIGIAIGKVNSINKGEGTLNITLAVDYAKLEYVYVINNKLAQEQTQVEAQRKKDE
jgi:rod shape-determining protein MreC